MAKFGGIGGLRVVSQTKRAIANVQSKIENMSPEEMTSYMEKATVGNAAAYVGGKMGIKNINAGKIDKIVDKINETRSGIYDRIFHGVLDAAESAGYKINLPDAEAISNYIMEKDIMGKIENVGDDLTTEKISSYVKNINLKEKANELGISIEKIPKMENKSDVNIAMAEKAMNIASTMGDIGKSVGNTAINIKTDVGAAIDEVKTIAKEGE